MACWKGAESYQEIGVSDDSNSDPGTSAQPKAEVNLKVTQPRASVWKPPKRVTFAPTDKEKRRKQLIRELTHSCPEPSRSENDAHRYCIWQTEAPPTNYWITFKKCCSSIYNIKDSRFVYVFQFLIALLCISAIIMGSIFFQSCEGSYPLADPILNILMGISGLVFVYKWLAKVRCQRKGDFYLNREKHKLVMCLVVSMIFMGLGYYFFCQTSPKTDQSTAKVQCTKIYYDYMYSMHVTNAVFLTLAIFFYLPDCCIYAWIWGYLRYQRLEFPSATLNYRNTGFLNHEFDFDADFE